MSRFTDLIKEHGTIEEFTTSVENAFDDGFCTWEEKENAIKEYRAELSAARLWKCPDCGQIPIAHEKHERCGIVPVKQKSKG